MVDVKRAPFIVMQHNQQRERQEQYQYDMADDPPLKSPTLPWVEPVRGLKAAPPLTISTANPEQAAGSPNSTSNGAMLHLNDERRSSHASSVQTGTESSPSSSAGVDSAASAVSINAARPPKSRSDTFRSSSIFRLGRRSFGRKKSNQEKTSISASELTTKAESTTSRGSLGSFTGWSGRSSTSQSSSPVMYRDAPSLTAPVRESMSSLRTGGSASASDIDGNRASSDVDSQRGSGRITWGRNRSSISLMGDSTPEGVDSVHRPSYQSGSRLSLATSGVLEPDEVASSSSKQQRPSIRHRFEAQRSFSSSSVPQWAESGSTSRAVARYSSSQSSPNSPGSIRKTSTRVPSSDGTRRSPLSEVERQPSSVKNHYGSQRASHAYPSTRREGVPGQDMPEYTTLIPFKAKKRTKIPSMVENEVGDSSDRADQYDLHQFLGTENVGAGRRPSQQNNLEVPNAAGAGSVRGVLRKTRSQSSFILSRRPSFLGGRQKNSEEEDSQQRVASLPQPGKAGVAAGRSGRRARPTTSTILDEGSASETSKTKRGPWEKMFASRMATADSSPELERNGFFASSRAKRGTSISSMDKQVNGSRAGSSLNGSLSANTSRPASPGFGSRLDSSGGAANLFGSSSSTPRQRASSILPSLPWRPRTASNADLFHSPSTLDNQSSSERKSSSDKDKAPNSVKVDTSQFDGDARAFVRYVLAQVPRSDYSAVLASSGDELHRQALHFYMQRFQFAGNPLDIALRKLLMSVCLPKETQQIDRVMEAFARRYNECNEQLFSSDDQPYVLAFSLMMLHTDAFNKNAKQKMSKQDYLRNTSSSGVRDEILEYLYDNLTFTQFIYVEDEDAISRTKTGNEPSSSGSFLSAFSSNANASNKNRIDPYYIIATGQTHTLRAEIANIITEDSPFSASGTAAAYDIEALNRSFVNAPSIEIVTTRKPPLSTLASPGSDTLSTSLGAVEKQQETVVTLRITKVGCISRKDDIVDDNKKAQSRRWKTCGMVLSSSQLLFFKDLVWTSALDQQIREQTSENPDQEGGVLITPRITYFRPDGVLALGDAIAIRDTSYKKSDCVIRLIARQGDQSRQYLIQTADESEMNDWIHKINFCAAFRASGLRIRGLDSPNPPSSEDGNPATFSPTTLATGAEGQPAETMTEDNGNSQPHSPEASVTNEGSLISAGKPLAGLMRHMLNARRTEVLPKLSFVSLKFQEVQTDLEEALRFARHLGILTPFMKVTRDRIEATAMILSLRIRQLRLELAKYGSRREILRLELDAGDRAAKATASTSSLDDFLAIDSQERNRRATSLLSNSDGKFATRHHHRDAEMDEGSLATPRVHTIPIGEDEALMQGSLLPPLALIQHSSPPPPPSSQHLMSDEPSLDDILGQVLDAPLFLDRHLLPSGSTTSTPTSADSINLSEASRNARTPPPPPSAPPAVSQSPRRFKHSSTAQPMEEAERWDRSKVVKDSKRVSLVTLPDAEHMKDLARLSMNHAALGSNIYEECTE